MTAMDEVSCLGNWISWRLRIPGLLADPWAGPGRKRCCNAVDPESDKKLNKKGRRSCDPKAGIQLAPLPADRQGTSV